MFSANLRQLAAESQAALVTSGVEEDASDSNSELPAGAEKEDNDDTSNSVI